jgi:hypothetical protein
MASGPAAGSVPRRIVGKLVLLAVRGLLLWLIVPPALLLWPFLVVPLRKRGVRLGQFLGWLDLNLISAIQRSLGQPFFDTPIPWTPLSAAAGLSHRIHMLDAF